MADDGEDVIVQCVNCILQIQHLVHIKCCECQAIMCVPCFRMGAETGNHRRGHNYEVIDIVGTATFDFKGAWGSQEEASLLSAAHKFKMGNWSEMVSQMGSLRSAQQASDYFDKCFIRGPVGQFGLAAPNWVRVRRDYLRDDRAADLLKDSSRSPLKYHLILEALKHSEEEIDLSSPNVKEELLRITRAYVDLMRDADFEMPNPVPKHEWVLRNRLPEMEDLDGSSDEEQEFKRSIQSDHSKIFITKNSASPVRTAETNGVTMNVIVDEESEDEDQSDNQSPFLPARGVKRKMVRMKETETTLSCNGHSDDQLVVKINGVHMTSKFEEDSTDEVDTVMEDNSAACHSSDDSSDEEMIEIEGSSNERNGNVSDGSEEFGNSRNSYTNEEPNCDMDEVDPDQPSTSKCNGISHSKKANGPVTPKTPISRKKKKNALKSKKMRRLDAFEKRMNSKNKKKELEDQEQLDELCPRWEIKRLRADQAKLCMDVPTDHKDRPKIRQDDLQFLGYNIDRDEFEHESFNDAETLISKLWCNLPEENCKTEFINNNIKFARIQNYIRTLCKRNARRRAVIEHGKIPEFFNFMKSMSMEKRSAVDILEDRSPMEKLTATLQQTLTKDELSRLTETVDRADYLKSRILKLQELQRQGVTTLRGEDREKMSPKKLKRKGNKAEKKKLNARWTAFKRYHKNQFTNGGEE